jgi:hypothetical protein
MQKLTHPATKALFYPRARPRRPRRRDSRRGVASGEVIVICTALGLGVVGALHILNRGVELGVDRLSTGPFALASQAPGSSRRPAASPAEARASSALPPPPSGNRTGPASSGARGVELSPVSNGGTNRGGMQLAQAFDPIIPSEMVGPTPREALPHSEMELNGNTELDASPFGTGDVRNIGPCPVQVIPRGAGSTRTMGTDTWFRLSPGDRLRAEPGCGGTTLQVPTPTS